MVQAAATPPWADSLIQKWIVYFERDSVQRSIRDKVVDPILNHILKQVFPYILLICVMFVLLLFSVLITLGVILFQARGSIGAAAGAVSA
jgi:uncharacterized membrane protein